MKFVSTQEHREADERATVRANLLDTLLRTEEGLGDLKRFKETLRPIGKYLREEAEIHSAIDYVIREITSFVERAKPNFAIELESRQAHAEPF